MDLLENAAFMLSCGRVKTEHFENADVTVSIYCISEHALCFGDHTRAFCLSVFFIEVRIPNIVIDNGNSLSNIES